MIIPDYGPANPYPSNIGVSGLSGTVSDVTVDVYGLGHDFFGDIDMALVGPHGAGSQAVLLMSDASEVCARTGINLTFADGAPPMPESGCPQSGSMYKPSNYAKSLGTDDFPLPAPQGVFRYGTTLSTFDGTEPNGAWSLYVVDDYPMFHGAMTGGWCLNITTSAAKP
jgi:subtilisin-like proprotein convertase family protein